MGRTKYFVMGVSLFALKHLLDRVVSNQVFGLQWSLFNYWVVGETTRIDNTPLNRQIFYATMVAIALPFIWTGLVLTLRRLRHLGWPLWLVVLFFFPFVNLLFFLLLSTLPAPEQKRSPARLSGLAAFVNRLIPRSGFGSALVGVIVTTLLTVLVTVLSAYGLASYSWGLFVGLPFCLGFSSVLVYGYHEPRTIGPCLVVSLLSVVLAGTALIAIAIEGVVCVLMAMPLGLVMAMFGGIIGYLIQRRPQSSSLGHGLHAFSIVLLALPALMLIEGTAKREASLRAVTTRIEIQAAPEEVWQQLIAFAELPPPDEWLFQTGIAYPVRAQIDGKGVGAVRHCVFSTGAFVEPIEVWDEARLLKFSVSAQPRVMNELSPYRDLRPPHLNDYLQSRKGQFHLTRLADNQTLLEGTTWYQNSFWPEAYWGLWSDYIIHRIHLRVLNHIKRLAES